jgi:hypothetical protein
MSVRKNAAHLAPGLKRKRNKDGTTRWYWEARSDLVRKGYTPSVVRLFFPETDDGAAARAARCRVLQAEMLNWEAHGGVTPSRAYDGTLGSLVERFLSDQDSSYRECKWNTQLAYDKALKIVTAAVGSRIVAKLAGPDFRRWHRNFAEPAVKGGEPRPWRGKHCMDAVRRVIAYGASLRLRDCIEANLVLKELRFKAPPARKSKMLPEHVQVIRAKAHELGLGSIALATVLQFELAMRQKDVIGEWLPDESGAGGIRHRGRRWSSGLTWGDIGPDKILRKSHVKTGTYVEHDLMLYSAVMEELALVGFAAVPSRPLIISEATGEPYKNRTFTHTWRRVADAAGIPSSVWNMDARSGAISEAYDAGADEVSVMKHAGHKNRQTSASYNRGTLEQTSKVARLRHLKRLT